MPNANRSPAPCGTATAAPGPAAAHGPDVGQARCPRGTKTTRGTPGRPGAWRQRPAGLLSHGLAWGLAGLLALAAAPAGAESLASSAASSASSAGSASVGSLSDSVQGSSAASSPGGKQAAGDWRVIVVAALPDRPGRVAVQLQREPAAGPAPTAAQADRGADPVATAATGAAAADTLWLHLPAEALAARPLAAGDRVVARARAYGLWFAHRATDGADRPFFLALHDDWQRELGSRAL